MEKLLSLVKNEEERYLEVSSGIFDDISMLSKKYGVKNVHCVFSFSYLVLIQYLYRYAKYKDYFYDISTIKELIGYSDGDKRINYLIKKNGTLDNADLIKTVEDFPIAYTNTSVRFLSEYDIDYIKNWRNTNNVTRNQYSKIPIKKNIKKEIIPIDMNVFVFMMRNNELQSTAFILYNFFKFKADNDIVEIKLKDIIDEVFLSTKKINNLIYTFKQFNIVKDLRSNNNEKYLLKINNFEEFVNKKINIDKDIRKITKGINDLWTTHPEIAINLFNRSDGYIITKGSNFKFDWICPNCKIIIRQKTVNNVVNNGLICPNCSTGSKYPEKFMYNLLNNLKVDFVWNTSFDWSEGKRYDFCFTYNNETIFIETNGGQHYTQGFEHLDGITLEEVQENDRYKQELALRNGVDRYVVIDCRKSDFEFIKNNILNSDLAEMFDLNKVDWNKLISTIGSKV